MDHRVRVEQVVEGVEVACVPGSQPSEHDRLPGIGHGGDCRAGRPAGYGAIGELNEDAAPLLSSRTTVAAARPVAVP